MIGDLLGIFKDAYEKYNDKLVLDIYRPKEGLYIRVNKDGTLDSLLIDKGTTEADPLFQWFRDRDYYSCLIDMNKSVDPNKKIHSNNYYTVFVKRDIFPDIGEKALERNLFLKTLNNYYEILHCPENKYKENKMTLELYESIHPALQSDWSHLRDYIINHFDELKNHVAAHSFKGYIKIFYDKSVEDFMLEGKKYLVSKIFNSNEYNYRVGDRILGLSNNNMGMNAKKPYLENKRTKYRVPYRIDTDTALMTKKLFDWLNFQQGMEMLIPVNFNFIALPEHKTLNNKPCYYVHIQRGTDVTIDEFEFLACYRYDIKFMLRNYVGIRADKSTILDDVPIKSIEDLEAVTDRDLFAGRLKTGYFMDPKIKSGSEFDKTLQNIFIMSRKAFHTWFHKGEDQEIQQIIERVTREIVQHKILKSDFRYLRSAAAALNLRLSILTYFRMEGYQMGDRILPLLQRLDEKTREKNATVIMDSDEEFYFACGQLAYYLMFQSKASNKNYGMMEAFLKIKNGTELKNQLSYTFARYNHAISMNYYRFNAIFSAVQGYETQKEIKEFQDIFYAGMMTNNLFLIKSKEEVK